MRKNGRKFNYETELNLVPMLDLFLSLIPFLLMSTVLVSFGGVMVEAPSQVASTEAASGADQSVSLSVEIEKGRVRISGYRQGFQVKVDQIRGDFDLKDLAQIRSFFSGIQKDYSKVASSLFHASSETRYEDAVAILNLIRATEVSKNLVLAVGVVQ